MLRINDLLWDSRAFGGALVAEDISARATVMFSVECRERGLEFWLVVRQRARFRINTNIYIMCSVDRRVF